MLRRPKHSTIEVVALKEDGLKHVGVTYSVKKWQLNNT